MRTWIGIGCSFAAAALLGVLHYADADADRPVRSRNRRARIARLDGRRGHGVASAPASGRRRQGVLQSTLGNLPELFIVIFALRAGEIVVAQTSILGSLLANALLVLGLAIIAGAWRAEDGVMRFGHRLPNDTTMLLMLVVFMITILSVSLSANDRASDARGHDLRDRSRADPPRVRRLACELPACGRRRGACARRGALAAARLPTGSRRARSRRGRGRVHIGLVRGGDRPGRRGARHLEGLHRPRHRRDRGERGRERRRSPARVEAAVRPGDLGGQELRRPDRRVPLSGPRAHLAALHSAADVRRAARRDRARRRARLRGARDLADHRRRRGARLRGPRARHDLRACSRRWSGSSSASCRSPDHYAAARLVKSTSPQEPPRISRTPRPLSRTTSPSMARMQSPSLATDLESPISSSSTASS